MYCPKCQSRITKVSGSCPKCGFSPGSDPAQQPMIVRPARRAKIPANLILETSVDGTGSSQAFQQGIPLIFERSLQAIEPRISSITVHLWKHGDLDMGEQPVQLTNAGTLAQAIKDIAAIAYIGGGDLAETHADQVEHLLNIAPWGSDPATTRNAMLIFATDDTKPLRSGKTMAQLGEEIRAQGICLFLVCQETPSLRELVDAAQGYLIEITNEPDDKEINQVVSALTASITASLASGNTLPMTAHA